MEFSIAASSNPPFLLYGSPLNIDVSPIDVSPIDVVKQEEENRLSKIASCLQSSLKMEWVLAYETATRIFAIQEKLQGDQAVALPPSDIVPYELVITKGRIHSIQGIIGEGGFSTVFRSEVIPTIRHKQFSPGKPKIKALKRSKQHAAMATFSPEKRKLEQATKYGTEGVDVILDTFKDDLGRGYSLNELYGPDITKIEFHRMQKPVVAILKVLISCSKALESFHQSGFLHRDVKGANILVSITNTFETMQREEKDKPISSHSEETISGVITDFGTLAPAMSTEHPIIGTPMYLDPSMFGSKEMSLYNLKRGKGVQTKEGDVFAFGITIYKDVLMRFIAEISKTSKIENKIKKLFENLEIKKELRNYSDAELIEIGKNSNYRSIYVFNKKNGPCLLVYPQLKILEESLIDSCLELKEILNQNEIEILIQLSKLSCTMQMVDLKTRPTFSKVCERLSDLLNALLSKASMKRRLDFEYESLLTEEQSPKKKLREAVASSEHLASSSPSDLTPKTIKIEQDD